MEIDDDLKQTEVIEDDENLENSQPKYPNLVSKPRCIRTDYSSNRYVKDDETSRRVIELAKLGLSKTAVALATKMSPVELSKWYGEEYALGQAGMQQVVAAGLMEQARAGNPQVLMYLGKSKLGWTESNTVEHIGTVNAVVSARPLTTEEFAAKYLNQDLADDPKKENRYLNPPDETKENNND